MPQDWHTKVANRKLMHGPLKIEVATVVLVDATSIKALGVTTANNPLRVKNRGNVDDFLSSM